MPYEKFYLSLMKQRSNIIQPVWWRMTLQHCQRGFFTSWPQRSQRTNRV